MCTNLETMANEYQGEHGAYMIEDDYDDGMSAILRAAHDDWELDRPLGLWSALWRSPDGRSEHYVVARTAPELADKLARAEDEAS